MKKFDENLAKLGWPVVTRDGYKARIICYDRISANGHGTLVALITDKPTNENLVCMYADGRSYRFSENPLDLFLTDTWEGHDENGNTLNEPELPWNCKEQRPDNLVRFGNILDSMYRIYEAKNHDYGDSFSQSIQSYGPIAGLTRISDKFHRLESLILKGEQKVQDESLKDTLVDMANYCVMLRMALDDR